MKKWKLLNKKPIFKSKWLALEHRIYELPDKRVENYYHLYRPNYVLILAINNKDRIVVEKQYRRGVDDFVYELPAGWIDKNEDPLKTAIRELKEETGFIGKGEIVAELYPQPAFCSMKAYVAILKINSISLKSPKTSKDENIKIELIKIDKIKEMIKKGKIKDMGTISAILIYILKNT